MSVTTFLDGDFPVSALMTHRFDEADLEATGASAWARRPSVRLSTTVEEATHLMALTGLRQLWVKDDAGATVGVLTASALFRWVTESEGQA
jgi:hypothetical protein